MPAEAGDARTSPEPAENRVQVPLPERERVRSGRETEPRVAVIVALGVERGCVRRTPGPISLAQSGPGEARAADAAARMLDAGAAALVSFGLAGGLAADAYPGRLLLPRQVVTAAGRRFDADPRWHARLAAVLAADFDADERPLLAAADVLETPDAKRRGAALGAAAADLESGAIASVAARAGVPFVVVRAVADGPGDLLPPGVGGWVGADGETRAAPVVGAALRPSRWPALWTLARRYRAARRTLARAAGRLAPEGFLFE